jgi:hypothetical protein
VVDIHYGNRNIVIMRKGIREYINNYGHRFHLIDPVSDAVLVLLILVVVVELAPTKDCAKKATRKKTKALFKEWTLPYAEKLSDFVISLIDPFFDLFTDKDGSQNKTNSVQNDC